MSKHGPRVRVSVDDLSPSAQRQSKDKICMILQRMFKKACQEYGVMQMYKEKEFFVSKGEKRRRRKLRKKMAILKGTSEQNTYSNNNHNHRYGNHEWNNDA
jgi:ribosomal protein S21